MGAAPHIIWPLRFVLPYRPGLRPAWMLRLGLFLYDHIGGRKQLPPTRTLRLDRDPAGAPLKETRGSASNIPTAGCRTPVSSCSTRAMRQARGAEIHARTACLGARRDDGVWAVTLESAAGRRAIRARSLVNAAGPWVGDTLPLIEGARTPAKVRLVKGSHIVVPHLYAHERCYFFQNPDGRIFFAIPYEEDFTLIGTTDEDYHGDPAAARRATKRSPICAKPRAAISSKAGFAERRGLDLFRRPAALRRRRQRRRRTATRDYVLTLETRPRRRCSTCSAAKSPPIAGSPRTRSKS